ncbi:uncharacterized protein LOC135383688 [Ornithodoros turicata]|uniref:uncharacterized protein LOC135383688 n=1 Tax=Ornithodoros turicata TaxID=34597 RepID=UPI003138BFA5
MSSLPLDPGILTLTYADDIAFFSCSLSLHTLREKLQEYLLALSSWMRSVHLTLNVQKSAVLVFPQTNWTGRAVTIILDVAGQTIRQTNLLRYLGVWYDHMLHWDHHVEVISQKASKAIGTILRSASALCGMRRSTLLFLYKCYVRPILEFGCVVFSHLPDYRLSRLFAVEKRALRLCMGLLKYTANQSPLATRQNQSLRDRAQWIARRWRKSNTPQLVFVESLLASLTTSLTAPPAPICPVSSMALRVVDAFQRGIAYAPSPRLEALLSAHINQFPSHVVVATDASVSAQLAGAGVVFPQLDCHCPIRLPDYTPVFESELLAMILALRMVPLTFPRILLLSDSLSVITALASPPSEWLELLQALSPSHITEVVLTWIPGHCGLSPNELADNLAKISLSGPIIDVLPPLPSITRARYRRLLELTALRSLPARNAHLSHAWQADRCVSCHVEVLLTRLRCLALPLNFYLHRAGVSRSPACVHCGQEETVEHFLLHCPLYDRSRLSYLAQPLARQGVPLSLDAILSFGASHTEKWRFEIASKAAAFLTICGRF